MIHFFMSFKIQTAAKDLMYPSYKEDFNFNFMTFFD